MAGSRAKSGGRLRHALRVALVIVLGAALLVAVLLALPVREWRTGEVALERLKPSQPAATPVDRRIWIDSDAACGTGAHRDPDDCLALLLLLHADEVQVAGISTVFGNAPLAQTIDVTRRLVGLVARDTGARALDVAAGCATSSDDAACPADQTPAIAALAAALRAAPLTLLALGPLTNVAAVLRAHPELKSRIERIVAVMGRRPGHRFHPSEGARGGSSPMLFGHGPIFSDFNVAQDRTAVRDVLNTGVPITLVPYDVGRRVVLGPRDLDRIAAVGSAGAWVAAASRDWLHYWEEDVGIKGFYPFDLVAAARLLLPARFTCAQVHAWLGRDPQLSLFDREPALLVTQDRPVPDHAIAQAPAQYCWATDLRVGELFE